MCVCVCFCFVLVFVLRVYVSVCVCVCVSRLPFGLKLDASRIFTVLAAPSSRGNIAMSKGASRTTSARCSHSRKRPATDRGRTLPSPVLDSEEELTDAAPDVLDSDEDNTDAAPEMKDMKPMMAKPTKDMKAMKAKPTKDMKPMKAEPTKAMKPIKAKPTMKATKDTKARHKQCQQEFDEIIRTWRSVNDEPSSSSSSSSSSTSESSETNDTSSAYPRGHRCCYVGGRTAPREGGFFEASWTLRH